MEVDADGCYDRMVPEVGVIACRRLGMPPAPGWMLIDCLNEMQHCVQTQLGTSTEEYRSTLEEHLFGTGQGSGGSPAFWLATSETILNTMDDNTAGYSVTGPDGRITSSPNEDKFIDDASLMTNRRGRVEPVAQLRHNSQFFL